MTLRTMRGPALQRAIAALAGLAFLLQGYNQAIMNGLITLPGFIELLPEIDTLTTSGAQQKRNAKVQGLVVSIYEVGCAVGALSCTYVGNRLGRPKTMLLGGIIAAIGGALQASTYSLGQTIAGRLVSGMGVGIFTATNPMYVSETVASHKRGPLVLVEGATALGGIALAAWVNFGMYYATGSVQYRFPLALQLLFILVLLMACPLLPESPRYLVLKERHEEAAGVLSRLMDEPAGSASVAHEVAVIHASFQREQDAGSNGRKEHKYLQRTLLACGITMTTQLTGINVIPFYSTTILELTLGYSASVARILAGCLNIALFLGGITAIFLVERCGRRNLMLLSTFAMMVSQAAVCGLSSELASPAAGDAALFFYFAALYLLPIGMFMIPFMYASEIAPPGYRHRVAGMAAATSWLFNFMVAEVTPIAITTIAWRYYAVFAACSAIGCVAIYYLYPETQGRSLEEIDVIFLRSKSIFDTVRVARRLPKHFDTLEADNMGEKLGTVSEHVETA